MRSKAAREEWQDGAREETGCEAAPTRQTQTEAETTKTTMGNDERSWAALEAQEEGSSFSAWLVAAVTRS